MQERLIRKAGLRRRDSHRCEKCVLFNCAKEVSTESLGLKRMTIMHSVVSSWFRSELSTHLQFQLSRGFHLLRAAVAPTSLLRGIESLHLCVLLFLKQVSRPGCLGDKEKRSSSAVDHSDEETPKIVIAPFCRRRVSSDFYFFGDRRYSQNIPRYYTTHVLFLLNILRTIRLGRTEHGKQSTVP